MGHFRWLVMVGGSCLGAFLLAVFWTKCSEFWVRIDLLDSPSLPTMFGKGEGRVFGSISIEILCLGQPRFVLSYSPLLI